MATTSDIAQARSNPESEVVALTTYTQVIGVADVEKLRGILERDGYEFSEKPYAHYSAKRGKLNVTVYEKGPKVLVQGKETEDFVKFTLEPEILGEARLGYEEVHNPEMFEPHFGIDESGKGDFFGPLVIAGAYTDGESTRALIDAGVMDSKRVSSAARIGALAGVIRRTRGVNTAVVAIGPERYNEMYGRINNLNEVLAWGHAKVIEKLSGAVPTCGRALSDQFANPRVLQRALERQGVDIELEQRTKGESDVAVAAASIIAREAFVRWIERASEQWNVSLAMGAGTPVLEAGKLYVKMHGVGELGRVAKLHFKTTNQVTGGDYE
jgi:ribonuclease HIII